MQKFYPFLRVERLEYVVKVNCEQFTHISDDPKDNIVILGNGMISFPNYCSEAIGFIRRYATSYGENGTQELPYVLVANYLRGFVSENCSQNDLENMYSNGVYSTQCNDVSTFTKVIS